MTIMLHLRSLRQRVTLPMRTNSMVKFSPKITKIQEPKGGPQTQCLWKKKPPLTRIPGSALQTPVKIASQPSKQVTELLIRSK